MTKADKCQCRYCMRDRTGIKWNRCLRCNHYWFPIADKPEFCPKCKSYLWNERIIKVPADSKEYAKEYANKYYHTPKGREVKLRNYYERHRKLGYIPLNEYFDGSRGHHVDRERVIYIPADMHKIPHSVLRNINMEEINRQAFAYLNAGQREAGEYGR